MWTLKCVLFTLWCHGISGHVVVTAPNVFHYGVDNHVIVSTTEPEVTLYLQDHPKRINTFSRVSVAITGGFAEALVRVNPTDFPEDDGHYTLHGRNHVLLVAETSSGVKYSTVIRVSQRSGVIHLSTDKPIYSPGQTVMTLIYSTDFDGKPWDQKVKLELVTPQGVIVDRKVANVHYDKDDDVPVPGFYKHGFHLPTSAGHGLWKIQAFYGYEYSEKSEILIDVEVYDLPRFSCEVSVTKPYILPTDSVIAGNVKSSYTFGKAVIGSVHLQFAMEVGEHKLQFYSITTPLVPSPAGDYSSYSFLVTKPDATIAIDDKKRLIITSECLEASSGLIIAETNEETIFTSHQYMFTFGSYFFKPLLQLVVKFKLYYANGDVASAKKVMVVKVEGVRSSQQRVSLSDCDRDVRTNSLGHGFILCYTKTELQPAFDEVEVSLKVENDLTTTMHRLEKSAAAEDVIIYPSTITELKTEDDFYVRVHWKGIPSQEKLTYVIVSRGRMVKKGEERISPGYQMKVLHVRTERSMVPSARLLVFLQYANTLASDSFSFDIHDHCSEEMKIDLTEREYSLQKDFVKRKPAEGTLILEPAVAPAYMVVHMVDKAVLQLPSQQKQLNTQRMYESLESLDLGCVPRQSEEAHLVFSHTGLALASSYRSNARGSSTRAETLVNHTAICTGENVQRTRRKRAPEQKRTRHIRALQGDHIDCCPMEVRELAGNHVACFRSAVDFIQMTKNVTEECIANYLDCCEPETLPSRPGNVLPASRPGDDVDDDERSWEPKTDTTARLYRKSRRIRRKFPESVFLGVFRFDSKREFYHSFELPHSMTTWNVRTVQMSEANGGGMCVGHSKEFKVVKRAFLQVNLPSTAVQGETLIVSAILHNLRKEEDEYTVTFEPDNAEMLCYERLDSKIATVSDTKPHTFSWRVTTTLVGEVTIDFKAWKKLGKRKPSLKDTVSKTIRILSPGVLKKESYSLTLNPSADQQPDSCTKKDNGTIRCNLAVTIPPGHTADSAEMHITTSPLVEVSALFVGGRDHVNGFLPTGGVKDYLMKLAPAFYAYRYLQEMNNHTNVTEQFEETFKDGMVAISKFINDGDGGVVAKEGKKATGTWITAFVVKVFTVGSHSHSEDQKVLFLEKALEFLGRRQRTGNGLRSGMFHENLGGAGDDLTSIVGDGEHSLTAFILVTLMEYHKDENRSEINAAKVYLERNYKDTGSDYEAILIAYALSLTTSIKRVDAYDILKRKITDEQDGKSFVHHQQRSMIVEMTAYAALTSMRHNDLSVTHKLMRWLYTTFYTNRGSFFQRCQDTVLAYQAFTEYESELKSSNLDLSLKVQCGGQRPRHQRLRKIRHAERQLTKSLEPPQSNSLECTVEASGTGSATAALQLSYRSLPSHSTSQSSEMCPDNSSYSIDVSKDSTDAKTDKVTVCIRHRGTHGRHDYPVVDVMAPTGLQWDGDKLKKHIVTNANVKEALVADHHLYIYLRNMTIGEVICVNVDGKRQAAAPTHPKPVPAKVMGYYYRDKSCTVWFPSSSSEDAKDADCDHSQPAGRRRSRTSSRRRNHRG